MVLHGNQTPPHRVWQRGYLEIEGPNLPITFDVEEFNQFVLIWTHFLKCLNIYINILFQEALKLKPATMFVLLMGE